MNFKSLRNKTQGDGKYIFAQPSMLFRNKDVVDKGLRLHVVREDEVTRPDLIALEYYGDQTKTDLILKWNGISDPFGLQPGDELIIPPSGVSFTKLERPAASEDNKIKNQFLQSKRFTKKDQRRLDALKKKYNKEVLLPPNVIPLGQKNYKFDKDGNIIFGAHAQNGAVNPRSGGNGTGGSGSGNGSGAGGNDAVVDEIFNDLGQDTRNAVLAAQGTGSGNGSGSSGSGIGKGLTETQLNNLLNDNSGGRGSGNGSGNGTGRNTGSGSGTGSGRGTGNSATNAGNNNNSGTSPSGSNNASGISNDGAPCN